MAYVVPGRLGHPDHVPGVPTVWVVLERHVDERGIEGAMPVAVFTDAAAAVRLVAASDHSMFVVPVPHADAAPGIDTG